MKTILFLSFILSACSNLLSQGTPKEGKTSFAYVDGSGRYLYTREQKLIKTKIISRTQISAQGSSNKFLEKSVMVSQLGSIKDNNNRIVVLRPLASDFTVWLEGKRYDSKMRLDVKSRAMKVTLTSPEDKWKGTTIYPFPPAKQFCFFSQIPDCLYHNLLLTKALAKKGENFPFYVIWDSYPYLQEQFTGVGAKLFAPAVVKYDGEQKSLSRFTVEVNGQIILYHFSKSFDLVRMFWIAQGISVVPPDEQMSDVEE